MMPDNLMSLSNCKFQRDGNEGLHDYGIVSQLYLELSGEQIVLDNQRRYLCLRQNKKFRIQDRGNSFSKI